MWQGTGSRLLPTLQTPDHAAVRAMSFDHHTGLRAIHVSAGPNTDTGPVPKSDRPPGDVVMFLLCIVGLIVGVVAATLSLPAARNDGTPGTFTAHHESCDRHSGCWWSGTFESDEGQIWVDEEMKSKEVREGGDQVRAQRVNGEVFRPGSQAWVPFSIAAVCCLAYLIWFVRGRLKFRQRSSA